MCELASVSKQRSSSYDHQFVASCWTGAQMENIREYLNDSVSIQSLTKVVPSDPNDNFFSSMMGYQLKGFSVSYDSLTADFVRKAHARLFSVVTWTVQDPSTQ